MNNNASASHIWSKEKWREVDLSDINDILKKGLSYWKGLCQHRWAPSWNEVELSHFGYPRVPRVTVVDLNLGPDGQPTADTIIYRFWGTGHVRAKSQELTGKPISAQADRAVMIEYEYLKVYRTRAPHLFEKVTDFIDPERQVLVSSLRMPLSKDGSRVDKVISVSDWSDAR